MSLGFQGPVRAGIRKRDEPFGWLARQSPGDSDTPWSLRLRLVLSRFSVLGPHGSTPGPPVRGVPGRPTAELAFLRHEAGGAGGRGPLRGAARAVSALRCALPRAARFGASPRTLASANQVARHLPPAPATWRGDEVLGSVQGQHSKRRGCQRSLARAAAAPSARRPEGRVQTPWEPRAGVAPGAEPLSRGNGLGRSSAPGSPRAGKGGWGGARAGRGPRGSLGSARGCSWPGRTFEGPSTPGKRARAASHCSRRWGCVGPAFPYLSFPGSRPCRGGGG